MHTSRPSKSDDSYTNETGQRTLRSGLVSSNITKRLHNQTIGRQSRLKADITVPMEHTKAISMIEEIDRKREEKFCLLDSQVGIGNGMLAIGIRSRRKHS